MNSDHFEEFYQNLDQDEKNYVKNLKKLAIELGASYQGNKDIEFILEQDEFLKPFNFQKNKENE